MIYLPLLKTFRSCKEVVAQERMALDSLCEKCFLYICYILSFLSGLLATVLPFWISTRIDLGLQVVQVNKDMNIGLWVKHQHFVYEPGLSLEFNDGLTGVIGTPYYTKGVKGVTGLMMTALSLLVVGFIYTVIASSRCSNCSKAGDTRIQLTLMAVMPLLAAVFMAVGVIVFYKEVLDEYELGEDKKHVGASFWLAVVSSVGSFLTGSFIIYLGHCKKREE